jgi:hypothetical protein
MQQIIFDNETMLDLDDAVYMIERFDPNMDPNTLKKSVAYINLDKDVYYLYQGDVVDKTKHGIYRYLDTNNKLKIEVVDMSKSEPDVWSYSDKLKRIDPKKIMEVVNSNNNILISIPETIKLSIPEELPEDDMLKRILKRVLQQKRCDLDTFKARFFDRNASFNFAAVIKKPGQRLSMLLFERGVDALNLKYTVIVEEKDDGSETVGVKLGAPIIITSEDCYLP